MDNSICWRVFDVHIRGRPWNLRRRQVGRLWSSLEQIGRDLPHLSSRICGNLYTLYSRCTVYLTKFMGFMRPPCIDWMYHRKGERSRSVRASEQTHPVTQLSTFLLVQKVTQQGREHSERSVSNDKFSALPPVHTNARASRQDLSMDPVNIQ